MKNKTNNNKKNHAKCVHEYDVAVRCTTVTNIYILQLDIIVLYATTCHVDESKRRPHECAQAQRAIYQCV